jgi:hypothetical protein
LYRLADIFVDALAVATYVGLKTPSHGSQGMAKRKSKGKKPPPRCKAILLCDQVMLDAVSRKTSLIGVFDSFFLRQLPGPTHQFCVFLQLVDGIGTCLLTAEVRDLHDDAVISRLLQLQVKFPDRTNKLNLNVGPIVIQLPHSGAFDLVIMADAQEIDRQRFEARLFPANPGPQAPGRPQPNGE